MRVEGQSVNSVPAPEAIRSSGATGRFSLSPLKAGLIAAVALAVLVPTASAAYLSHYSSPQWERTCDFTGCYWLSCQWQEVCSGFFCQWQEVCQQYL